MIFVFDPIYMGKMAKISPKIDKIEIWPFFWSQKWALLAKVTVFGPQKNARKQIHSKIQFYTGICVTSFDFERFLL